MQFGHATPDFGLPGTPAAFDRQRASVAAAVPELRAHIETALAPEGAVVVLLGDAGSGRLALAEVAARELVREAGGSATLFVLPQPPHETSGIASVFAADFPGAGDAEAAESGARVLAGLFADASTTHAVLIAPNVDLYSPIDSRILELVLRDPRVRALITVKQLTSAVERLGVGASRSRISVAPLDIERAGTYLSVLLGVERIESDTLRRWFEIAGGNSYALAVLALSSDGSGALRRSRGTAWTTAEREVVSSEYARVFIDACTPAEIAVLELVAVAEPVTETVLLRSVDAACLSSLFERGLIVSQSHSDGLSLTIGNHLLASMLRAGMSPVRRIQLNDQIFRVLSEELGALDPVYAPERLMRLVVFGIEGGHELPFAWLWAAFELMVRGGDPRLVLNLALAVTVHPGADAMQAGAAALRAYRLARLIGDAGSLRPLLGTMQRLLDDSERAAGMTPMLRTRMTAVLIKQGIWDDGDVDIALSALEVLERSVEAEDDPVIEVVRSTRVQVLAYAGRLRDAACAAPSQEVSSDLKTEWVRSPARAISALILDQQGEVGRAVASAENTRMLSRLGPRARPDFVDMQGFCWLLGYWVSGSAEAARQVLEELVTAASADTHAEAHYSGLVEAGTVLIGVQEARWTDAAQSAERLLERLGRHDSYGLAPLTQAALALALAVLGERDAAVRAIRAAGAQTRGLGQAVGGHRGILALRARQWLRDGEAVAEAGRLADWARAEGLALIELQALHAIAFETRGAHADDLARARALAEAVDEPLGAAYVAHMERIAAGAGVAAVDTDEPEVRMLAELGVWLPLPPAPGLTAREREIALLAALGHSSRFIAERLHISARTVETHLSNVFAKIGVENRDELRVWAARDRAAAAGATRGVGGAPAAPDAAPPPATPPPPAVTPAPSV
ncbi:helix-turn-helix transcriptional regulator [Leucobacter luti]|uniref:Regulatory LuxR family protein n=1 Tax=Leucobacter luti TaxID=340320 RepID=A0A4Q7TSI1_9MICO|nr:helix-turn-helix transcriptional regulator [Leucobacter luti]MBL3700006.1 LuxR family transcriptional regulator [Leucobacter luti]RZT62678.1 regulatory LuxR family protein [Leucobacter luti]